MWLNGLILLTTLTIVTKCNEIELTVEAAFQGHCGHNSPCEQLCYEIHDGMYECDCTEGYELNKNGYSCQELNTSQSGDGMQSEEDVLYQKGVSFSAKLQRNDKISNQLESDESGNDNDDDNNDNDDEDDDNYLNENNSNDENISSENTSYDNNNDDNFNLNSVPEQNNDIKTRLKNKNKFDRIKSTTIRTIATATTTPTPTTTKPTKSVTLKLSSNGAIINEDYFNKMDDMSIYDDVDNNKLNLRQLNTNTYQNDYYNFNDQIIATTKISISTIPTTQITKQQQIATYKLSKITTEKPITTIMSTNKTLEEDSSSSIIKNFDSSKNYDRKSQLSDIHSKSLNNISSEGSSSSISSDTCSLDCGPDGACEFNEDNTQSRCQCPFGKTGKECSEDIKIDIPRFTNKSWLAFAALRGAYKHVQLRVEFRPETFDGIILLTGERDDLTGDFMALLIHQGFIEFWFDCGSGVGSVRSKETVLLNQWNTVSIYRHRWDAWLVLNHGTRVQGRSKGLFSRITFREPVFLGGTGNITGLAKRLPIYDGMVGCIRRFIANEHEYKFTEHPLGDVTKGFDIQDCTTDKCFKYPCQHGGKCLPSDQGAVCLCPLGFGGDLCEMRLDLQVPSFNGSSYLRYAPLGDSALIWLELLIIIKPNKEDGIILYSGNDKGGDFILLSLNGGYVEFSFDLGSGPALVKSDHPITMEKWHTIKISRTARLAVLKVDQLPEVMTISSNGFWHLSLSNSLFLGGIHNIEKLPDDFKATGSFAGCIQKVQINGRSLSIISEALGGNNVDNCPHACVARPCGPLAQCVPQLDNYECRCNPFNAQCNKAEEVPLKPIITNNNQNENNKTEDFFYNKNQVNDHSRLNFPKKNKTLSIRSKHHRINLHHHRLHQNNNNNNHNHYHHQHQAQSEQYSQDEIPLNKFHGIYKKVPATIGSHNFQQHTTTTTMTPSTVSSPTAAIQSSQDEYHQEQQYPRLYEQNEKLNSEKNWGQQISDVYYYDYDGDKAIEENEHRTILESSDAVATFENPYLEDNDSDESNPAMLFEKKQYDNSRKLNVQKPQKKKLKHDVTTVYISSAENNDDKDTSSSDEDSSRPYFTVDKYLSLMKNHKNEQTKRKHNSKKPTKQIPQWDLTNSETLNKPLLWQHLSSADVVSIENLPELSNSPTSSLAVNRRQSTQTKDATGVYNMNTNQRDTEIVTKYNKNINNKNFNNKWNNENNGMAFHKTAISKDNQRKPFLMVDVLDEDYHTKELYQDMERIMKNSNDKLLLSDSKTNPPNTNANSNHGETNLERREESATGVDSIDEIDAIVGSSSRSSSSIKHNFGVCFTGTDSYFHYNDAETMSQIISYKIDLNLRFKTHSTDGVILWTGRQTATKNDDYLSLGIENGYLHLRYNLGSGETNIQFNVTKVSDGLWHRVRALRNSQEGILEVDGRKSIVQRSPGKLRQLNTDTGLYVGGMPDVAYYTRRRYYTGIIGCISEIILTGELTLNLEPATLGTAHNVVTGIL